MYARTLDIVILKSVDRNIQIAVYWTICDFIATSCHTNQNEIQLPYMHNIEYKRFTQLNAD